MKKFRFVSLVLVLSLLMPVLTLTACTDKNKDNGNKPRTLDTVEQSIVGTWKRVGSAWGHEGSLICFYSDGTWTNPNDNASGKFRHLSDYEHNELGHYALISIGNDSGSFALFDNNPNKLYSYDPRGYNGKINIYTYLERQ